MTANPLSGADMTLPAPTAVHLKPLTSLRFAAALWVALFSYWPHLDTTLAPLILAKGYLGVELFFILSGFILCHVYLERFGTGQFSYRDFIGARLARIYPMHIATLLGVLALGLAATAAGISISANVMNWQAFIPNLLMVHAWGVTSEAGWNHPSWSISAEWFAYLTFPAYAFIAWRLRERPLLAVILAGLFLVGLYEVFPRLAGFALTQATFHWGALRIVPCFAYGCALYIAYRKGPLRYPLFSSFAALFMLVFSAGLVGSDTLSVLSAGSLIVSLASLSQRNNRLIGSRPAVWLGEISYALYMCCAPWLMVSTNLVARITQDDDKQFSLLIWLGIMLSLILISALCHHLIERPSRQFLRRLMAR